MALPGLRTVEQAEEAREGRRLAYEPGLDGMRGVGVALMMLWHAQVSWIGDGPLFTIEMFFVLSGFLITSLFIIEHDNHGSIDLKRFWVRRVRRLMPALVGLVALVTVWTALPRPWGPNAFETTGLRGDGIASMLYVSNWWFIISNRSYFQDFGAPSPFLHTWSLSIEEQFYVIVAVLAFFGLRRWSSARRGWIVAASIGAVCSAVWMAALAWMAQHGGSGDLSRAYYGTDARLQSVLVGVATAFLCQRLDWSRVRPWLIEMLSVVGCGGLLLLFLATPKGSSAIFYGGFLLCDVLTAMAIVSLMAPKRPTLWHTLSSKPLVAVGVLSYSLYVWHFPLFLILTEERTGVAGWQLDVLRIGVSAVVAYLSYRFVEYPIRTKGLGTVRRRAVALGAWAVVVVAFLVVSTVAAPAAPGASGVGAVDVGNRPVLLVTGDSMAWTLGMITDAGQPSSPTGPIVLSASTPGCPVTQGDRVTEKRRIRGDVPGCLDWPERWAERVDQFHPALSLVLAWGLEVQDRVVTQPDGTERTIPVPSDEWRQIETDAVQQMVDVLSADGGEVVLLTLPCLDASAADAEHPNTLAVSSDRVDAMNEVLRDVAAANPETTSVVELGAYLCPDGEHFQREMDGVTMSVDGVHFSEEGATKLWQWLVPQLEPQLERRSADQGG